MVSCLIQRTNFICKNRCNAALGEAEKFEKTQMLYNNISNLEMIANQLRRGLFSFRINSRCFPKRFMPPLHVSSKLTRRLGTHAVRALQFYNSSSGSTFFSR
jgi:hypothetical protein